MDNRLSRPWRYILILLAIVGLLVLLATFSLPDSRLHLVFCDVGQGDAALIYRGTVQILVDGGPDNSVLSCLSRHLPFWDRKIELVVMTHPQEDHLAGLVDVVRRYQINTFMTTPVGNPTATFAALKKEIEDKKIKVVNPKTGTKIKAGLISLDTVWPSPAFLAGSTNDHPPTGDDRIPNTKVLGAFTTSRDLNEFSLVQRVSFGEFDALLTGDIVPTVSGLIEIPAISWEVLKVPHHGSKNGLTADFLSKVNPKLAVISVGKNNRYGHPHEEVIRLLGDLGIRTLRTDQNGEVEIISDGQKWWIAEK